MSCPKCLVHSDAYPRGLELRKSLGIMPIEDIVKVLDEIESFRPMVSPSYWGEPLLNKRLFRRFTQEASQRNIPVMINTNALLINDDMAEFLVEHVAIISISIDAFTAPVLEKTRASSELVRVNEAVHRLLRVRGDQLRPRIVVSFSEEDANAHEKDPFIDYWIKHVDAIRVNDIYSDSRQLVNPVTGSGRQPCREIYDSMNIDFNGVVRMCCVDGYRETNLGNAFDKGVIEVWNGEQFLALRRGHEGRGELDSFCLSCDQWAGFNIIEEYKEDGLLVRKTAHSMYLNRLDRITNWTDETKRRELELI